MKIERLEDIFRGILRQLEEQEPDWNWEVKRENTGPVDLTWVYATRVLWGERITGSTMIPTSVLTPESLKAQAQAAVNRVRRQFDDHLLFNAITEYTEEDTGTITWN